jgi:SdpC family antimicrobial peptide
MAEPAAVARVSWSGQELFKGLYLMDGPVADRIATYSTLREKYQFDGKPELKQELSRLGNQFVRTIEQQYPSFFRDFQRSIQSGDHFQVTEAMAKGSEMLQYAIQQDPELNKTFAKGMEMAAKVDLAAVTDQQGRLDEEKLNRVAEAYFEGAADSEEAKSMRMAACSLIVVCVAWILVAVAHQAAVTIHYATAINVAVWISLWVKTVGPKASEATAPTDLQREMVIQEITEEMALNAQ